MEDKIKLIQGDCLEKMKEIPDGSIDMILCDLPYGTMKNCGIEGWSRKNEKLEWDTKINTLNLFEEYERILRENGVCVLFSQEPYTSELRTFQKLNFIFCYPMIWEKDHFANGLFSKKAPVNYFEDLSLFTKPYDRQLQNPLRIYAKEIQKKTGLNKKQLIEKYGQQVDHFFRYDTMQFGLCNKTIYEKLTNDYELKNMDNYLSYEKLLNKYKKYQRVFNLLDNKKIKSNILKYKKKLFGQSSDRKTSRIIRRFNKDLHE